MIEQIQNYVKFSRMPVRLILFISKDNVLDFFLEGKFIECDIDTKYIENNIYVGELSRVYGRKDIKKLIGRFLLFKHENYDINLILTHESTSFFENGLFWCIKKKYPIFALPFYYSWEMEIMLNELAKTMPKGKIMLTKISSKARLSSGESRKRQESDLTWTDLPYKEVFRQIRQNDGWVEKLSFDLVEEIKSDERLVKSTILNGFISRDGIFKCERDFKIFYKTIIEKSIEIFFKKREKFSNRARVKEEKFESKPLIIEFDEPIFKYKEQNFRLIYNLKSLINSASSIIHDNPYLHATVTDYTDNSNYDIWILSDNRITVVPQTVCSMSSLNRLFDHISKEFPEGIVRDIKETS
jgi:hypothetical protein